MVRAELGDVKTGYAGGVAFGFLFEESAFINVLGLQPSYNVRKSYSVDSLCQIRICPGEQIRQRFAIAPAPAAQIAQSALPCGRRRR